MTRPRAHRLRTPRLTGAKARLPEGLKRAPKRWQARALTAAARRLRADVSPADAVLVTSTPRSGSTWLFEQLAADPTTFPLFEPFHPGQNPSLRPFADQLGCVARPTTPDAEAALRRLSQEIYAGREITRWSTNRAPRRRMARAQRTLIKEVRINRALGWFVEALPVPTVVLVRHPCAVVDSMLRATQEDWNFWTPVQISAAIRSAVLDVALDDVIDLDTGGRLAGEVPPSHPLTRGRSSGSPEDSPGSGRAGHPATEDTTARAVLLAVAWAADVRCALEAIRGHDRSLVVSYERLYVEPTAELQRIGRRLGLETTHADSRRPSLTTLDSSPLRRGADPLASWQYRFAPDTARAVVDVAHRLGVSFYTADPLPDPAAFDGAPT